MAKENQKSQELKNIIEKWQINQRMLAENIKMNYNTFRLKLSGVQAGYGFTVDEYAAVAQQIEIIASSMKAFVRVHKLSNRTIYTSKK